jgi:SMI1-KNR4 cell-wall
MAHRQVAATEEHIARAEAKLGVQFPEAFRRVWLIANGLELPSGWLIHPVFNPEDPRHTCNDIALENTQGRPSYMASDLLIIAGDGTGDALVLRRSSGALSEDVLVWNHETRRCRKSTLTFQSLLKHAQKRAASIEAVRLQHPGRA